MKYFIKLTGRKIKRFFSPRTYKVGQIVRINGGEKIKLLKFLGYNNVYSEKYRVQFVDHSNLQDDVFICDTKLNREIGCALGEKVEVL